MSEGTTWNFSYGRRKPQIKKQDLYMLTALWMEQSPWAMNHDATDKEKEKSKERVVGAVFVQPNHRVLSVDCSRSNEGGIVHGAIRALIQYPDQVEGCYVYLSRQPCAHCVKMLVQAAVKKDLEELKSANKKNPYGTRNLETNESIAPMVEWDENWKKDIVQNKIGWKEYSDIEIGNQVNEDMKKFFEWFERGILATGEKEIKWKKEEPSGSASRGNEDTGNQCSTNAAEEQNRTSDNQKVDNHLSRLAQMLSYRTDDPNSGVGCVIALEKEIVAIGWNGFPSKALYGNHPRGSTRDQAKRKKYPHIIYALENAVLSRNRREIDGCVVYHTITPSDEGISILYQLGAKVLVLPSFLQDEELKKSKPLFYDCLQQERLIVFNQIRNENF